MRVKNILLTATGYSIPSYHLKYYYSYLPNDDIKYCTAILGAEAGVKYILSKNKIDEICVLIPSNEEQSKVTQTIISKCGEKEKREYQELSQVEIFRERIRQYLANEDLDSEKLNNNIQKVYDSLSIDLLNKAKELLQEYFGDEGIRLDIIKDEELVSLLKSVSQNEDGQIDLAVVIQYLYNKLPDDKKMTCSPNNTEVGVRCVKADKNQMHSFDFEVLFDALKEIFSDSDCQYNVSIDLKELGSVDSNIALSIISMINIINNSIKIDFIVDWSTQDSKYVFLLSDESEHYGINEFISGVSSYIEHGKVDMINEYCKKLNVKDNTLKNLLLAMEYIDSGISLNNVYDLQYGLKAISLVLKNDLSKEASQMENLVYRSLKYMLNKDIKNIIDEDEIIIQETVKWAYRKKYYQQTLTLIESLATEEIVKKGIYYYAKSEDEFEKIMAEWSDLYWKESPKNRYVYDDLEHMFIKTYGKWISPSGKNKEETNRNFAELKVGQFHDKIPELLTAYTNATNEDAVCDLLYYYYQIGSIRNKVSHADNEKKDFDLSNGLEKNNSYDEICDVIEKYIAAYDKALNLCNKNSNAVTPKIISQDMFKKFRNEHKPDKNKKN